MNYFIEEQLVISEEDIIRLKNSHNLNLLKNQQEFNIISLKNKTGYKIYKNLLYFAIETQDVNFLKKLLNNGYFLKTIKKENEEIYKFNTTINEFVSHLGLHYNFEILNFLLFQKKKTKITSIIKNVFSTKNMRFINKLKSIYNIYRANNSEIKIQQTEIIQNLIESENLPALKEIYFILNNIKYNEINYYLTAVRNEDIINYMFSLNIQGSKFYNELSLSCLIEDTPRFQKFYEKMRKPMIDGILVSQIIEAENIDLLEYLYRENKLNISYDEKIFENVFYHAIFKNKLNSLKLLIKLWNYDLEKYEEIKLRYGTGNSVNKEMDEFVLQYKEKKDLKNKLEKKLINRVVNKKLNKI